MLIPIPPVSTAFWTPENWVAYDAQHGVPIKKGHGTVLCDCDTCCKVRASLALGSFRFTDKQFLDAVKLKEAS